MGPDDLSAGSAQWISGRNDQLDLDGIPGQVLPIELPDPAITLTPTEGVVTRISGEGFTPDSIVTVTVSDKFAGDTIANTDSTFAIVIAAPDQNSGTYTVTVTDTQGTTLQSTLIVPNLQGEAGLPGEPGVDGSTGKKGDSGGTTFAIVALILSVIAAFAAGIVAIRVSTYLKKR